MIRVFWFLIFNIIFLLKDEEFGCLFLFENLVVDWLKYEINLILIFVIVNFNIFFFDYINKMN